MMYDLVSIEFLIRRSEKLASSPKKNKEGLDYIREIVIKQVHEVNNINIIELKRKMDDYNTNADEYYDYLNLFDEIKKYDENSDKITAIVNRKYSYLRVHRTPVNKKVVGLVVAGSLALGAGLFGTYKIINRNKINEASTQDVTEYSVYEKLDNSEMVVIEQNGITEKVNEQKTETVETKNTEKITEVKEEKVTESQTIDDNKLSDAEQETIVEVFKTMNDDVDDLKATGSNKTIKQKGKEYIINIVDFIFYNASINGITYKDLDQKFQEKIYGYLGKIDSAIMTIDPDYKEELGEKYNAVKDFSKNAFAKAKELIISKIGQERYDAIIETKNEILDKITEGIKKYGGKALEFIQKKYQDWKEE